ncbi:MAG TPA: hypothetical protein VFZ86_15385 [Thermoleophilia bacterium]|nr:hypothetical protein [Thermoleophilia bacterium]
MSEEPQRTEGPGPAPGPEAEEPAGGAGPAVGAQGGGGAHAGLRLLAAAVMLPWLLAYGIFGVSAVTRSAQAYGAGLERIDPGYTRFVSPGELAYVGALLLAAFAVLLACSLLLLFRHRTATGWLPVLLVAAGLTAGSVWAAVQGGLHPILWVLFFFGLACCTAIALARVLQVTRSGRRGRIASP